MSPQKLDQVENKLFGGHWEVRLGSQTPLVLIMRKWRPGGQDGLRGLASPTSCTLSPGHSPSPLPWEALAGGPPAWHSLQSLLFSPSQLEVPLDHGPHMLGLFVRELGEIQLPPHLCCSLESRLENHKVTGVSPGSPGVPAKPPRAAQHRGHGRPWPSVLNRRNGFLNRTDVRLQARGGYVQAYVKTPHTRTLKESTSCPPPAASHTYPRPLVVFPLWTVSLMSLRGTLLSRPRGAQRGALSTGLQNWGRGQPCSGAGQSKVQSG